MDIVRDFMGRAQAAQQEVDEIVKAAAVKTAWDACGDWWWTESYEVRIKGGRTRYAEATATRDLQRVVLTRLKPLPDGRIRTVRRYVDHNTPIELVKPAVSGDWLTSDYVSDRQWWLCP